MTFLEFIGPEKAMFYGLAFGFVLGALFSMWCDERNRKTKRRAKTGR